MTPPFQRPCSLRFHEVRSGSAAERYINEKGVWIPCPGLHRSHLRTGQAWGHKRHSQQARSEDLSRQYGIITVPTAPPPGRCR
jgi:hypothetical protein